MRVTGEDAAEFLQGQFSQDLRGGEKPGAAYGFWLTRTGKVQGDSWVVREADGSFTVLSRGMVASDLMARFEHHIIADEVYLADETAAWSASWWAGAAAMAGLQGEAEAAAEGWGWVLPDPVPLPGGSACRIAKTDPETETVEEGAEVELERVRLLAGVPRVPADVGDGDLPQEGGLERVGVSFNKGCYLGQEVMARVQSTGRVRRRLVRVRGEGEAPTGRGEALWTPEREVGTLRSRVALADGGWVGLALVGAALADATGGDLRLAGADGPVVSWSA